MNLTEPPETGREEGSEIPSTFTSLHSRTSSSGPTLHLISAARTEGTPTLSASCGRGLTANGALEGLVDSPTTDQILGLKGPTANGCTKTEHWSPFGVSANNCQSSLFTPTETDSRSGYVGTSNSLIGLQRIQAPPISSAQPISDSVRSLWPANVGGNETLSITIPVIFPTTSGATSTSPSLHPPLLIASAPSLTPSPMVASASASPLASEKGPPPPLPLSLGDVPEYPRRTLPAEGDEPGRLLLPNEELSEEEKIDVCSVKETLLLKEVESTMDTSPTGQSSVCAPWDPSEWAKKDSFPPFFSQLGSQCSRTLPSLMKFYSRHKRSLYTSLSVNLALSGQATPPCSPISPGTLCLAPPVTQRSSLEASTMTSPTDRSAPVTSAGAPPHNSPISASTETPLVADVTSPIAALALLSVPDMASPGTVSGSKLTSPTAIKSKKQSKGNERELSKTAGLPVGIAISGSSPGPMETSPTVTSVGSIPPGLTYPSPWSLPHNTIAHPGSFWLHHSQFSGVEASTGLGLGYHMARDPLTGHLFLLSRTHPMSDPGGHGLVWAGYGGVPPPPVVMTPQQLLLDPRYRPALHAPPPIMQLHHAHPPIHPQQQQQAIKKEGSSPVPPKEDNKKASIPIVEVPNNQPAEMAIPPIPTPTISPHFLYPSTSLPYYYPQPAHHTPYNLSAFTHPSNTALGLPTRLPTNLLAPLTTHPFTTSTTTVTTTVASLPLNTPLSVSSAKGSTLPPSSVWSRGSSNPIPSPGLHQRNPRFPATALDPSLYSEPPMDLTRRSPKSPCELANPTVSKCNETPQSRVPSLGKESFYPVIVTTASLHIKKEIKEEVFSPCFSFPEEVKEQTLKINTHPLPHQIKSESSRNLLMFSEDSSKSLNDFVSDMMQSLNQETDKRSPAGDLNDQGVASETQSSFASLGTEDTDDQEEVLQSPSPPVLPPASPVRPSPSPLSSSSSSPYPCHPLSTPNSPAPPPVPVSSLCPPNVSSPPPDQSVVPPNNAIDSSGLVLLLETFLQHGDRLAPSPTPRESDLDSISSQSEQMPHLERAVKTPSPRCSPASFESQPPVLTPFAVASEAASPLSTHESTQDSTLEQTVSVSPPPPPLSAYMEPMPPSQPVPKQSGFSVLCALAEQRIMEEQEGNCSALSSLAEVASSTPSVPTNHFSDGEPLEQSYDADLELDASPVASTSFFSPTDEADLLDEPGCSGDLRGADINRNYKSPESEREARAFIANKVSRYQKETSVEAESSPLYPAVDMDPAEVDMRMKLADLQRQYKEKQRELSRLQPKKDFTCGSFKRGRGRPPKSKVPLQTPLGLKKKVGRPLKKVKREASPPAVEPCLRDPNLSSDPTGDSKEEDEDDITLLKSPVVSRLSPRPTLESTSENSNQSSRWHPKVEEETSDEESNILTPPPPSSLTHLDVAASFKLPPKHEESDEDRSATEINPAAYYNGKLHHQLETSVESSTSDAEIHSTSSSSKKRKPGRPKKHSPTKYDATETIVAKKPKTLNLFLLPHKPKVRPKLKAELKVRSSDQEDDHGTNPHVPHQDYSDEEVDEPLIKSAQSNAKSKNKAKKVSDGIRRRGAPIGRTSLSRNTVLREKEKRKSVFEKNSRMQELYRSLKRCSACAAAEHDESEDEKEDRVEETSAEVDKDEKDLMEDTKMNLRNLPSSTPPDVNLPSESAKEQTPSLPLDEQVKEEPGTTSEVAPSSASSAVEAPGAENAESGGVIEEDLPCAKEEPSEVYNESHNVCEKEKTEPWSETSVCSLQVEDLVLGARVLVLQDGLLYAGNLSPITPPDVYGIHIDGERGTRPHICCQEELLTQAWKEVKPGSTRFLTEGTRVCAFWSQQYRGLYPGCVAAASSPTHEGNHNLVNVEFDDGDSGRIHVDDIRLLPQDFPIIEYDPNPLMSLNKRKRRPTEEDAGDVKPPPQKNPKKVHRKHRNHSQDGHDDVADVSKVKKETRKEGKQGQKKRKRTPQKSTNYQGEKRKHKKRKKHADTPLHKHKHKRKHKHRRRNSIHLFPHVEQGDSELRMRIKSPPPLKGDEASPSESSSEESHDSESESQKPMRRQKRSPSEKSKIAPFLLERQLWRWSGKGYKRPGAKGKGKKEFYKEIVRGKEHIRVGDCAVFLSSGSHERPFIGKIDFLWEAWGGNMVVKVKWFYHPDETIGTERKLAEPRGALFSSSHTDENDVQTISHKCHVVPLAEYRIRRAEVDRKRGPNYENYDLYYLAGYYDPTYTRITMEPGVS